MGILTDDMKRVVRQQRLGFIATVCPDGSPNLSPKGTATVWDDDHLVFADLGSPVTIENLRHNPACEINVVDAFLRKGYRFKGTAQVVTSGDVFHRLFPRLDETEMAGESRPSLQHIIGQLLMELVATEAQRSEREAWEASTLPLSYARPISRMHTVYICDTPGAQPRIDIPV